MDYIIGVDGGGTKTEACAFNLDGEIIATGYSGYGNMLIDAKIAISNIMDAISQCLEKLSASQCIYICLGLAGIESGMHLEKLEIALQTFQVPYKIVNDARIAHAALLSGKDGILTISGTGSVSYGVNNGKVEMTGGWGHLLGDEGSGYWIAIESFKQMVIENETINPISPLSKKIMNELNLKTVSEIKGFIYSASKGEIASIVPLIVEEAEQGNEVATQILKEAGRHLGLMTLRLCRKLAPISGISIAIKGSVLTHISFVRETFMETITLEFKDVNFIFNQKSSTLGAYYIAMNALSN